ncbi:sugar-transfer associated ATP-grasp domain-containing protein [Longibacter sp.]|uniref:sugar-transfer associated ATP-grasp domain-containing protein n=1 Tax=Longibacter sp. TaxID=2045415 RepID=UPI003EB81121
MNAYGHGRGKKTVAHERIDPTLGVLSGGASAAADTPSENEPTRLPKSLLEDAGLPVPDTYARITRPEEVESAWSALRDLPTFVLKPIGAAPAWKAVLLKKVESSGAVEWRTPIGRILSERDIVRLMENAVSGMSPTAAQGILAEYRCTIDDMFYQIYPRGLSYVRIITYCGDPKFALARIPTDTSDGRATLQAGALCAGIDMASGRMHPAHDRDGLLAEHPDTYSSIEGVRIWRWDRLLDLSMKAAEAISMDYLHVETVIDAYRGPLVMDVSGHPDLEVPSITEGDVYRTLSGL